MAAAAHLNDKATRSKRNIIVLAAELVYADSIGALPATHRPSEMLCRRPAPTAPRPGEQRRAVINQGYPLILGAGLADRSHDGRT